jgi:hypothetical protein
MLPRILSAMVIGIGATLCIDLWALFLRKAFGVRSLDYCLLGRWMLHMPGGTFAHRSIAAAAGKPHECKVGWAAHYSIGIGFAVVFVLLMSDGWLAAPTFLPALMFGAVTVAVPFFTMQPALGFGIASSRTPKPGAARLKSIATHSLFGMGIYLSAILMKAIR